MSHSYKLKDMQIISDLQIHSKYSRAVSQEMVIPKIWEWAKRKGIGLMATGDWTHPLWMREINANLEEVGNGLLKLKSHPPSDRLTDGLKAKTNKELYENKWNESDNSDNVDPLFLLATEVSSIYSQGGKVRRIHTLIWSPTIESADKINKELINRGANLIADGRPIIGLSSIQVAELVFSIDPTCLVIPAHAWTPWFSLYGSESGFDSIDECFGSYAKYIYAIETGLSSNPAMNWRIKELDHRAIVSFSDAHSGPKLGREATVFNLEELSYIAIREAIIGNNPNSQVSSIKYQVSGIKNNQKINIPNTKYIIPNTISYTIEFYPEEGKYHYSGHRNCGVKQDPSQTKQKGTICPVCGRKLTIGVMHRVEQLAERSEEELEISNFKYQISSKTEIQMTKSNAFPNRPPFVMMVPLQEILAEALGGLPASQKIQNEYNRLIDIFGNEFNILLKTDIEDISRVSGARVAEAIQKVRTGDIYIDPGYDGVFGKVKIWFFDSAQDKGEEKKEQMSLF